MTRDQLTVLAIAAGCAVVVGLLGRLLVSRLRRRGLATLLTASSCVVLAAVGVAVWVDSRVMFLSTHDGVVVGLTLAAATPLALAFAVWLAHRVGESADTLAATARAVGGAQAPTMRPVISRELAVVQDQLLLADAELRQARERERSAESSRRQLVAWVSHDLRTPLAGIRAMAEALEDGVPDSPAEYHKPLRIEADRLSDMVDTLFLLSRLHAGALPPQPERIALRDLVSDAVATVAPVAEARRVSLQGDIEPAAVASVDPGQFSRALANLLINGVHHTPAGGCVLVRGASTDGGVVLQVQDACGGIPDDDLPRVFDLAWRGASARTTGPDGGGGLGLAVTQGIVAAHGGEVSVVNSPPGCVFEVRLPAGAVAQQLTDP